MSDPYDAIVVGAGAAGLTAAIYLARFRRRFVVLHDNSARLGWLPRTHNHPGFPGGVTGKDLRARMVAQAEEFGALLVDARVKTIEQAEGLFRLTSEAGHVFSAPHVILATGVCDNDPKLPDTSSAIERGLLRMCPICDAFELIGQSIGVIGNGAKGAREALFLRTYSDAVTLIHVGMPQTLAGEDRQALAAGGVDLVETAIGAVRIEDDHIRAMDLGVGGVRTFDAVYSALGSTPRAALAEQLGAVADPGGCLHVDDHQQTSVPGLYAAGDVVRGLNQISIAQSEAAIAATHIHNQLRAAGA